jgi:hypothetical protein
MLSEKSEQHFPVTVKTRPEHIKTLPKYIKTRAEHIRLHQRAYSEGIFRGLRIH